MKAKTFADLKPGDKVIRNGYHIGGGSQSRSIVTIESMTKSRIKTKGGESFSIRNGKKIPKSSDYFNPFIQIPTPDEIAEIYEAMRLRRISSYLQNSVTWSAFGADVLDKVKEILEGAGCGFQKF